MIKDDERLGTELILMNDRIARGLSRGERAQMRTRLKALAARAVGDAGRIRP